VYLTMSKEPLAGMSTPSTSRTAGPRRPGRFDPDKNRPGDIAEFLEKFRDIPEVDIRARLHPDALGGYDCRGVLRGYAGVHPPGSGAA